MHAYFYAYMYIINSLSLLSKEIFMVFVNAISMTGCVDPYYEQALIFTPDCQE